MSDSGSGPEVRLLRHTQDAEMLCAAAAHSCYSDRSAQELIDSLDRERAERILDKVLGMGHHSVIEHASYTFSLEGVSRSLTHQLVRHRLASYSQQSQRYVSLDRAAYVTPPSVAADESLLARYREIMERIWEGYRELADRVPVEDARYLLPNACRTNITVTMNARELWHLFTLRCCNRAQWEIREVADRMLLLVREVSPLIFKRAGPPCVRGPCPEGEMGCGEPREDLKKG
ncbi:MAG: FAD-dependent thymidylate synthase [Methanomassiliicoccales archaeon]